MVSVVVPVYNVEEYLEACVESILAQTYKEFELILIDDGSTDQSGAICDKYSNRPNVQVVHQENRGLSAARNAGLQAARGEFICFVDSDDWVEACYLETLALLIKKYDADIAVCEFKVITEGKNSKKVRNGTEQVTEMEESIKRLVEQQERCSACTKMFRKTLFKKNKFPEGRLYEDLFIMHRIFLEAKRVAWSEKPLYNYRMRNGSIIHRKFDLRLLDKVEALRGRFDDLEKETEIPERIKKAAYMKYIEGMALACVDLKRFGYGGTEVYKEYLDRIKKASLREILSAGLSKSGLLSCALIKISRELFESYVKTRYCRRVRG